MHQCVQNHTWNILIFIALYELRTFSKIWWVISREKFTSGYEDPKLLHEISIWKITNTPHYALLQKILKTYASWTAILGNGDTFRVILHRNPIKADKDSEKEWAVPHHIQEHGSITNREAGELLGLADSMVKWLLSRMIIQNRD